MIVFDFEWILLKYLWIYSCWWIWLNANTFHNKSTTIHISQSFSKTLSRSNHKSSPQPISIQIPTSVSYFFPYQTTSSLLIIILHIQETPLSPSISQFKNKTLQIIYKQSQKGTTHTKLLGMNLVAKKRKVK